jgi:trimethylguanosine synthase
MPKNINPSSDICPFGDSLQRYWDLRFDLFTKFDQGVQIDKEVLYSVKPEESALRIASRMPPGIVLDAFGGVGGSAIGFARSGRKVVCIEQDWNRIAMAKNNACVYGVHEQIKFVCGDFLDQAESITCDSVYFDPPWGGPAYTATDRFRFDGFSPTGTELLEFARRKGMFMGFTVPRNFDFNEIRDLHRDLQVTVCHIGGRLLCFTFFVDFRTL